MKHSISIIMPAYNEGGCIFDNIRMTRDIMIEAGIDVEIVAVDDGSSDTTLEEIRRAAKVFGNVVVAGNPYNMGKGRALRSGFEYSSGEIVVFLDADLDLHPSQIKKLIDVIEETPCDVVVTSKHHPESRLDYPFSRKIASLVYYIVIRSMFNLPVRDTQTGLKVFRIKYGAIYLHDERGGQDGAAPAIYPERHIPEFFPRRQNRRAWFEWLRQIVAFENHGRPGQGIRW